MKLGAYTEGFTVDQARALAKQVNADVLKGKDPAGDRASHRVAETFEAFSRQYMEQHAKAVKKPSSIKNDQWMLDRYILPKLGSRKVIDLTGNELGRFVRGHGDTPILANRLRALLSKMMALAIAWGVRHDQVNPLQSVEKYPERSRERYLTGEEIKRLGEVLGDAELTASEPWQSIAAIRLLLLTGCRRGEILSLQWSFIDSEHGVILLPDSKTGRKTLYLTSPVAQLLDSLPRKQGCLFVLPAQRGGEGHFVGLGHVWERLRAEAGLEGVRLHDLRHTFASWGAGMGLGLPLIGALLGHSDSATTAKYAHLAADPTRKAGSRIAQRLRAELAASGQVVAFPRSRAKTSGLAAAPKAGQAR
jgi:integrase